MKGVIKHELKMELSKFADELYTQLEQQLAESNSSIEPGITRLSESMQIVTNHLNLLRKFIKENEFESEHDEIRCFKFVYPRFYSWYIYLTEDCNIAINTPVGTEQMIREYYLQEIALIKRFFNHNQFAYQYYLQDETALDEDQDSDMVPLKKIIALCKQFGAKLMVDDAHGTGVIGKTGRGLIEACNAGDDVDLITGTFSKTFGHIGGYVVASEEMVNYLKYQSKQHLFSASPTPAAVAIIKAIELIDEEPLWMGILLDNIKYFRHGLLSLGLNIGDTNSAIFPVRIGDKIKNARICYAMQQKGVYVNQINYPAVSLKDARIRMGVTALHERAHLDEVLNVWADIKKQFQL